MALLLKGAPVAEKINGATREKAEALKKDGVFPVLCIVRVGDNPDDLSYERSAMKKAASLGIGVRNEVFPLDIGEGVFLNALSGISSDKAVHGILLFLPLPQHINSEKAKNLIDPAKDVDGCTLYSAAGVYTGNGTGFAPCTAQACMEILDFYNISLTGRKAAVIGRSLVIGRPLSMMLMEKDATVTICHSKTPGLPGITRGADILVTSLNGAEILGGEYISKGQTVIDVGIAYSEEKQKLCGNVNFEEAKALAAAITPVPGGVGAVTTAVLMQHVVQACERSLK